MKTKEWKQRAGVAGAILLIYLCVSCLSAWGQASTSRQIPFNNVSTTIAPGTTGQTLTLQLWDAPTAGNQLYCENQTLDVAPGPDGVTGVIAFDFGAGVLPPVPCPSGPPELKPGDFVSGQSRFLDVVDTAGGTVLPNGRIPFKAVGFAINPGPQGPPGAQGPKGDQGPPGVVQMVTNADTSITVAGTAANPTVALAANGITNSHVANGALNQSKITGTAAILYGSNTFNGPLAVAPRSTGYGLRIDQGADGHGLLSYVNTTSSAKVVFAAASLAAGGLNVMGDGNVGIGTGTPIASLHVAGGNLNLDNSSAASGNILKGGNRFIHNFGGNTFIGINAGNLTMMSSANNNTGAGINALSALTTGCCNTANGNNALLQNTTGSSNTAVGDGALYSNSTGNNNTAVGRAALISSTTASGNTAFGVSALQNNSTGPGNTATGFQALQNNTTGNDNTATGGVALSSNTTGFANTASGVAALTNNTVGARNTASGVLALRGNTTGNDNTAMGFNALYNTNGDGNTGTGHHALISNTTGSGNTAIGWGADVSAGNLTNATAIGYGAIVDASNKIVLGNAAVTTVATAGTFTAVGDIGANGKLFTNSDVIAAGRVIAGKGFTGRCMTLLAATPSPVTCDQFDVAETFSSLEVTEPGDVLILANPSSLTPAVRKSSRPYDDLLLGVVSTSPGMVFDGAQTHMAGDNSKLITPNKTVVGLAGRVPVKVSMENGAIRVGDPLTSSSASGVAMKATRAGKILGYALESTSKSGKVLLFVQPGYYAVPDLKRLHAENATLRTKIRKLSADNSELRATLQRIHAENIQARQQLQDLFRQVNVLSSKLDNSSTLAQSQP